MYHRILIEKLNSWKNDPDRKPLILRGARQVGKTTLVELFAKQFDTYLGLNLELAEDRELFERYTTIQSIVDAIYFVKKTKKESGSVLLFIDEIQYSSKAVSWLRYFYEELKEIHVIAAGSLLESLIGKGISFPVGRVEFLPVRPFSFREYLMASADEIGLEALDKIPVPVYAHSHLLAKFREYALIGGMPAIIKKYLENRDIIVLSSLFDGLVNSYKEDIEKHSGKRSSREIVRHVIEKAFIEAGSRIKYQHFGSSDYKSREVREAFLILEKAMLLRLVFPVVSATIPLKVDYKKSPKLQLLDTGLINFVAGLQADIFASEQLLDVYRGKIAEHIVGQELLALNFNLNQIYHFWTREKGGDAEVDYVFPYRNLAIPIEVKSGKTGVLRSLNEFMDRTPHEIAIRIYGGELAIHKAKTRTGKAYNLINLPFYLTHKIEVYIEWAMSGL